MIFPQGSSCFWVALPLSLGIAQASGVPPFVGLLTGVIGGLVVTLLSPSRYAVSGPAAGLVTIIVGAMETLGSFSLLLVALIMAGVLQLIFGLLRAGRFISLVPGTVIQGMLAAIGLLLIMQQIPVALGYQGEESLSGLLSAGSQLLSPASIVVALGALFILWAWTTKPVKRIKMMTYIPGPLVAVLWGGLAVVFGERLMPEFMGNIARIALPKFDSVDELGAQLSRPGLAGRLAQPFRVCDRGDAGAGG
ncbi:Putative sulfate transporter ychM [Serratia rubidaea]|uniref:Sulfate transporter ychM n=1 Tax=Serratia rubidaea TaxID=61652 RepID=A0A4U9H8Y2_SERRU|nr:Putative sulfate transporter ychM [Serratia rubidaea]